MVLQHKIQSDNCALKQLLFMYLHGNPENYFEASRQNTFSICSSAKPVSFSTWNLRKGDTCPDCNLPMTFSAGLQHQWCCNTKYKLTIARESSLFSCNYTGIPKTL